MKSVTGVSYFPTSISMAHLLLVKNAAQVVSVCQNGERLLVGENMDNVVIHENASIVVNRDGKIEAVGSSAEIEENFKGVEFDQVLDASGKSVIPGLVDGHTHPVWAGDRVHEFAMKLAGASYMDIHAKGGGIHFTVKHTTEATEQELLDSFKSRLRKAIGHGTTLLEAKSGYGLKLDAEMKMLKVIHQAAMSEDKGEQPDIISTYLAAHAVPPGSTPREATDDIIKKQVGLLAFIAVSVRN